VEKHQHQPANDLTGSSGFGVRVPWNSRGVFTPMVICCRTANFWNPLGVVQWRRLEEDNMNTGNDSQDPKLQVIQLHFAWLRTRLALENTLGTWIRTAAALIGFGFAIVQFFEGFNRMEGVKPPENPHLPRYLGLLLIGVGTLALAVAIWQYHIVVKHLRSETFKPYAGISGMRRLYPSLTVAILLCVIGALAFLIILMRGTGS
jgi:putative membrane protein